MKKSDARSRTFLRGGNIIQIFVDKEKCSRREEIEYRCWQVGFVVEGGNGVKQHYRPDPCPSLSFFPNVLTFSYSFLGLSLPFLASFVPLPPVALMIPIFYDRLIDNLSTN
jgi:hypothetical protein